ncbi:MAG: helix-turn-helix domain-containing protein [Erysipelotrichaceae bacterium]|nr:helix-turn-helix domain-containing protein [Erysipelotrichaceae bacterium]
MTTSEIIKKLRKERGLTQEQLGQIIGVQKSAIAKYESGRVENLKRSSIEKLAKFFDVSPSYLLGINDNLDEFIPLNVITDMMSIPILENVTASCGTGSWAEEDIIDYVGLPTSIYSFNKHKKYFAQVAKGDSMINAGIEDGNLLVFETYNSPENNMIGSFSLNNTTCVCKIFRVIDGRYYLMPANENYLPIEITPDMDFRMVGLLKYIVKEVKWRAEV